MLDPWAAASVTSSSSSSSSSSSQRWDYESADYELLWPRELFVLELKAVRRAGARDECREYVGRLLEEAFLGPTPAQRFRSNPSRWWVYVEDLLEYAPQLREHHAPRPYWSVRRGGGRAAAVPRTADQVREDFAELLLFFDSQGYLARAAPKRCVDDPDGVEGDLDRVLAERLGVSDLWPPAPASWDEDLFYDLVEVVYDLVARPRKGTIHPWNNCGRHYGDFATDIGRALYRWRVNRLLDAGGVAFRLAGNGEDIGRLVHVVDDARVDLLDRALATPDPGVRGRIEHAIAQFRARCH